MPKLRPGTWDAVIWDSITGGEYGPIDFKAKVVLDVGAHIGAFAALAAQGGAFHVEAYEPDQENYELLCENVEAFDDVVVAWNWAVWRSDVVVDFLEWSVSRDLGNTGGGGTYEGKPTGRRVLAVGLDVVLERLGRVHLMKIDCEGSEWPILLTSRRLDQVDEIVSEWHTIPQTLNGEGPWAGCCEDELAADLRSQGFDVTTKPHATDPRLGIFRAVRRPTATRATRAN